MKETAGDRDTEANRLTDKEIHNEIKTESDIDTHDRH